MRTRIASLMLAGVLATALAPGLAFAAGESAANEAGSQVQVTPQHFAYDNIDLAIGNQDGDYPDGAWIQTAEQEAAGTYIYKGYAHGDNAHYGTYSLYTVMSVEDGVLTGLNLKSGVDTFFGKWGTYSPHSNGWTVNGWLPAGVSFTSQKTTNDDGSVTIKPILKGADAYGYSVSGMYLESATSTALADNAFAQVLTSVNRRTGQTSTTASAVSSFIVTADNASDYCTYDAETGTVTIPTMAKDATYNAETKAVEYGEEDVANPANLIRIVYKIGEYAPFTCYIMVDDMDPDADAYLGIVEQNQTDYSDTVAVDGMGNTNRNRWTKTMLSETAQRWLSSWSAGLVDESLVGSGDNSKEVYDLDIISGATKTSTPFLEALYTGFENGYFKSVAEDLAIAVDGDEADGYVITRDDYTDQTSATVNADGQYVVSLDFFRSESEGTHGVQPNKIDLYALGDQVVGPNGIQELHRANPSYTPVDTFESVKEDYTDEYVSWDADTYTLTILKPEVTHLRTTYTLGHADSRHAYGLADLAKATELNATAETATDTAAYLASYNALPNDARGFLGTKAYNLVVAARAIANVDASDAASVEAARAAYSALSEAQQKNVPDTAIAAAEQAIKDNASLSNATVKLAKSSYTYTGKAIQPAVTVTAKSGEVLKSGTDYTVSYKNNTKAGTATVTVAGTGAYSGAKSANFTIAKANQPLTLAKATRTVKLAKVKKAKQTVAGAAAKKAQGTVTYAIAKVNKAKGKFSINKKNGKITVKKGTAKGTYKVTVKASAKGNANYKSGAKTAVVTIKVK